MVSVCKFFFLILNLNPQKMFKTYFCICSQYFLCCLRPKMLRNNQTNKTIRTGSTLLSSWMSLITSAFKLPPQTIQNLETYRCLQRMFTAATHRNFTGASTIRSHSDSADLTIGISRIVHWHCLLNSFIS